MVFRYLRHETGAAVALIANVSDARIRSLTASRSVRRQKASFLKTLDWTSFLGRISKVAVSLKTRWIGLFGMRGPLHGRSAAHFCGQDPRQCDEGLCQLSVSLSDNATKVHIFGLQNHLLFNLSYMFRPSRTSSGIPFNTTFRRMVK